MEQPIQVAAHAGRDVAEMGTARVQGTSFGQGEPNH